MGLEYRLGFVATAVIVQVFLREPDLPADLEETNRRMWICNPPPYRPLIDAEVFGYLFDRVDGLHLLPLCLRCRQNALGPGFGFRWRISLKP